MASIAGKQANKKENEQKVVSTRDKCSMDDTLASKTHAWTCKQACKDAYKANGWHKQA